MIRKFIYYIVFYFVLSLNANAQQVPLYSQYMMNGFLINPAVAGNEGYTTVNLTAREQWLGLKNSPRTHALSIQSRILKNSYIFKSSTTSKHRKLNTHSGKTGLGAYVFDDLNGAINRSGILFSYAHHIKLKGSQLSFGLSAGGYQFTINQDNIKLEVEDQFWQNAKKCKFVPDANFGVYFTNSRIYGGFSVSQLFQCAVLLGETGVADYKMKRYYYLTSGYNIDVNEYLVIEPSILFKTTGSFVWQADFNTKFIFNKEYWAGFSYRTGGALIFLGGVKVNNFLFGYAFDYNLNSIMSMSYGSHEFMIALKFGDKARRFRWLDRY